jgi:hypothetical protein
MAFPNFLKLDAGAFQGGGVKMASLIKYRNGVLSSVALIFFF